MGSKLSRAVREHKAAASPRVADSHHERHQREFRQEEVDHAQTDDATITAIPAITHGSSASSSTPDNHAMDIDQYSRKSIDSRSVSILQDLEQLPGVMARDDPLPAPPLPPVKQEPPPPSPPSCLICDTTCNGPDKDSPKAVYPCSKCTYAYCVPCLKNMFIDACKDLSRMPPRCCNQIPIHHVRPYLKQEEIILFKAKYEEWGTPNPFYCPVARCSTFIPNRLLPRARTNDKGKQRVDSGIGTPGTLIVNCPKCEADICTSCRKLAHDDGMCSPLEFHGIDEETADLLKKWGYKKCPKCGNGVKRMYGCSHMECRCGAHFCWVCMKGRDNCIGECDDDDDDDSSYYEPDEEEDEEEIQTESSTPPESNLSHVFPHMSSTGQAGDKSMASPNKAPNESTTGQPADATTESLDSSPRVRNLDGGSARYWEEQDLDFGDEPTDDYQDRMWDCDHSFYTATIKLADAFTKHSPNNGMECMKCWTTVHPEVKIPARIKNKPKTTIVASQRRRIATPSRRRFGFPQSPAGSGRSPAVKGYMDMFNLRGSRSVDDLVPSSSLLGTSPASFPSSFTYKPKIPLQDNGFKRVVDLYGNTVATAKEETEDDADEETRNWTLQEQKGERGKSRLTFATNSTPFSFAYECCNCGLLVCHRCKKNLEAATDNDTEE